MGRASCHWNREENIRQMEATSSVSQDSEYVFFLPPTNREKVKNYHQIQASCEKTFNPTFMWCWLLFSKKGTA